MMTRLVIITAFVTLSASAATEAADITGNWAVTITTADGKITGKASLKLTGDKVTGQIGPSEDATIPIGGALTADKSTLKTRPQPGRTAAFDSCELTVGDEKLVGTIHGGDAYSPLIYGLSRGARSGARASVHRASSSSIATEAFSWTSVGLNSCV